MLLHVYTFVLVLVTAAHAQKNCCFPPKWEGTEVVITGSADSMGHGAVTNAHIMTSIDATMEAIYVKEKVEIHGQPDLHYQILQLYKMNSQYIITNGKCTRTQIGTWEPSNHCVPDNATMVRQYFFGNQNSLRITEWAVEMPEQTETLGVTDDCVPATEMIMGHREGTSMMTVSGVFNITTGINDPSVFTVPDICKTAPPTTMQDPWLRKKRSMFSPTV